jgi:hypothetical protein
MPNETKRRFIRLQFPYTIEILPDGKPKISTYTEDISEGGIGVVIKESLDVSSIVDLKIYIQDKPLICKGKIAWVQDKANNLLEDKIICYFKTGIELMEIPREDMLILKTCVEKLRKIKGL